MTLEAISDVLIERGIPTKTGKSTRWTHQVVARILGRLKSSLKQGRAISSEVRPKATETETQCGEGSESDLP